MYKAVNKPLTILGAERKLFMVALMVGGTMLNAFKSLTASALVFAVSLGLAQWATKTDPQILRILLNAGKFRRQYDPAKFRAAAVKVSRHA